jgi:hypothetical protein
MPWHHPGLVFALADDLVCAGRQRDGGVLLVLERDRRLAADLQEDFSKARLTKHGRAIVADRVRMAGGLAMGENDPALLARDRFDAFGNSFDRHDEHVSLAVHGQLLWLD